MNNGKINFWHQTCRHLNGFLKTNTHSEPVPDPLQGHDLSLYIVIGQTNSDVIV